jgi:hypothetical protein
MLSETGLLQRLIRLQDYSITAELKNQYSRVGCKMLCCGCFAEACLPKHSSTPQSIPSVFVFQTFQKLKILETPARIPDFINAANYYRCL